ncbi:MAG: NF041680 family putative transposase [Anaerolineales bacterium]
MDNQFQQFRCKVYQNFNNYKRTDTLMDLVDALSSNVTAKSVVELTLNPEFRRTYTALNKALAVECLSDQQLARLAATTIDLPKARKFQLLGSDVTSNPRPYAETLKDRGFVYQPNTIKGNKPITIGHQYSFVALLPERDKGKMGPWVVPLAMRRVTSQENKELVGAQQIRSLLEDDKLPFRTELCVEVVDSSYSKPAYLNANRDKGNLVTIARVRGSRTFYHALAPDAETQGKKGHPTWYGTPFRLKDPQTWGAPDETAETTFVSQRKVTYRIEIQAWHNLVMRGTKDIPMRQAPFTLVKICWYNQKGEALFHKPLWLIVMGDRRAELSLLDIYEAYLQRYDLEHFFRFGKQKLLLNKFQTPNDRHEANWWRLVALAYLQLWVARNLVSQLPRPWERYLPSVRNKLITPAAAQRDMSRIIRQIGTPSPSPKPRGKSTGRRIGTVLTPRKRLAVIKKTKT